MTCQWSTGATNIWNIARCAGLPLKIDPLSLKKIGPYSRVLVDVDYLMELPERVLVQRKSGCHEFYASLYYEFVPFYCHSCGILCHNEENYKRHRGRKAMQPVDSGMHKKNSDLAGAAKELGRKTSSDLVPPSETREDNKVGGDDNASPSEQQPVVGNIDDQ